MVDKQRSFAKLLQQGVSISEACRRLGIDRKTGHWWKNGGAVVTSTGTRIIEPVIGRYQGKADSDRSLRHTLATLLFDAGAAANDVQAILGHSSMQVTEKYTKARADAALRANGALDKLMGMEK